MLCWSKLQKHLFNIPCLEPDLNIYNLSIEYERKMNDELRQQNQVQVDLHKAIIIEKNERIKTLEELNSV